MDKLMKRWNKLAGTNSVNQAKSHQNPQDVYGNSFVKDLLNENLADKLKAAAEGGGEGEEALESEKPTVSDSEMIKKFKSGDMASLIKSIPPALNDEFQGLVKLASDIAADGDKAMMIKVIKRVEQLSGKSAGMDFSQEEEK